MIGDSLKQHKPSFLITIAVIGVFMAIWAGIYKSMPNTLPAKSAPGSSLYRQNSLASSEVLKPVGAGINNNSSQALGTKKISAVESYKKFVRLSKLATRNGKSDKHILETLEQNNTADLKQLSNSVHLESIFVNSQGPSRNKELLIPGQVNQVH